MNWFEISNTLANKIIVTVPGANVVRILSLLGGVVSAQNNLKDAIADAIQQIATVVKAEFLKEIERGVRDNIDSLTSMLRAYANNPSGRNDTFDEMLSKSSDLKSETKNLGVDWASAYALSASINLTLIVLNAWRLKSIDSNWRDEWKTVQQEIDELEDHIENCIEEIVIKFQGRFSPIIKGGPIQRPGLVIQTYYFLLDGKFYNTGDEWTSTRENIQKIRQQHIDAVRSQIEKDVVEPLRTVCARWSEVASSSPDYIIENLGDPSDFIRRD